MPTVPAGVEKEQSLRSAGFTDQEIEDWKSQTARQLSDAGFSGKEVEDYFGIKNPDMAPMKQYFEQNLKAHAQEKTANPDKPMEAEKADSFLEYLDAGWQMSVSGLIKNQKNPDTVLPEDAPMYGRIISQIGTLAGDMPAMVAGAVGGGTVAGPIGAGTAAFALPAAVRKALMDHYEKGDIQDFGDFWERSSAVLWEATKQGTVGFLTSGAGNVAGKVLSPMVSPVIKGLSTAGAEIATMVTAGKAIEGEVPKASDFLEAAIVVGGLHGATHVAGKARGVYAKTGVKPEQLAELSQQDPVVKQELLSQNVDVPKPLEPIVEVPKILEPEPKVAGENVAPRPEATEKILSQVGELADKKAEKVSLVDESYRQFVDKLDPIKIATEKLVDPENLGANENPYTLSRLAVDYRSKVLHTIEKGNLDFNTLKTTGKPLKEIFAPHMDDLPSFDAYLISKRALEVEGRGLKSGFDVEAAKEVVSNGAAKYESSAKELVEWQNRNLKYLKDSGRISQEFYDAAVESGESYLPFKRIIEDEGGGVAGTKTGFLKEFKGSDKKIQSPLTSILENAEATYKLAERNRAVRKLVDLASSSEGESIIERVDNTTKSRSLGKNEFEVYRDGKREVYKTEPALAEAIKSLDGDPTATGLAMRLFKGLTAVKKIGITLTPEFIIKNVFRDQLTAGTFSKNGTLPFTDIVSAMGDMIKKNDHYYNWLKSGGANGAFIELNRDYLETNVFKLNKETKFLDATFNVVKKPFEVLAAMGTLADHATRLAEFKRTVGTEASGPKIFEGGYASREITVDFQRVGAKIAALNSITAFMNVSIQGLDRTIRAIKDDPAGVSAKAAMYITAPSVLLWWANHDDPRWEDIPRWQKDTFWIIMTDNWQDASEEEAGFVSDAYRRQVDGKWQVNKGIIYRLPKPQELGILFGSVPERVLEKYFTENPKALSDFNETMVNLVTPSLVPDAVAPAVEQYMNKSFFTGKSIVPGHLEGLLPEYQYTEYTSETAKALGKMVAALPGQKDTAAASPVIIENYMRSWSGALGSYALKIADEGLVKAGVVPDPVAPTSTLADMPVIRAFVIRHPSASAQSLQDFYDKYNENRPYINTIKKLAQTGDFTNLDKEMTYVLDHKELLLNLEAMKDALANQSAVIQRVNQNPDISPDEKRQLIDGLYFQMIEESKLGLSLTREIEASLKEK